MYKTTLRIAVPEPIQKACWSKKLTSADLIEFRDEILLNVVEFGNMDAVKWITAYYSKKDFRRALRIHKRLDPRTRHSLRYLLNEWDLPEIGKLETLLLRKK